MNILLGFSPFFAFVVMERLVGPMAGLVSGAVVAAGLLLWETVGRRRAAKVLEVGTFLLFLGLAVYAYGTHAAWPIAGVRLRVDLGLMVIAVVSMGIGRPFTLQYARERTASEVWGRAEFRRTNYVITAVWAGAFGVLCLADLLLLSGRASSRPALPILITVAALYGAARFTQWYPERVRRGEGGGVDDPRAQ